MLGIRSDLHARAAHSNGCEALRLPACPWRGRSAKCARMAARRETERGNLTPERLRVFHGARQGMAGGLADKSAAEVVAKTGWMRSVGGCNPYLALRDRAGLGRE